MRTVSPKLVKTALALRGLLFLGGLLIGACALAAAHAEKKYRS